MATPAISCPGPSETRSAPRGGVSSAISATSGTTIAVIRMTER